MRLRVDRQMMSGVALGEGAIFWYYGYLCATPVPKLTSLSGFVLGIVYLPRDHMSLEMTATLERRTRTWLGRVARGFRQAGFSLEPFDNVLLVRVSITQLASSWWVGVCTPDRYWRQAVIAPGANETGLMYRNMEATIGRVCFEIQKLEGELNAIPSGGRQHTDV